MQEQKIVIWGTGRFAELAYYYYKDICDILFFVDSNSERCNSYFCNLPIKNPESIKNIDARVILAFQSGRDSVKQLLKSEYGIFDIVEFGVEERKDTIWADCEVVDENTVLIYFSGGLGNQLFQLALLNAYSCEGKKTVIDVTYYDNSGVMDFCLRDAFELPDITILDKAISDNTLKKKIWNSNDSGKYLIYKEPTIFEEKSKEADPSILKITGGYIKGTFQSYYFVKHYKDSLFKLLKFRSVPKEVLEKFSEIKKEYNIVSVHIRRGDYLTERNNRIYGNICTEYYYRSAMNYILNHVQNVLFCFFSNDMDYVKKTYQGKNCVYFDKDDIENYKDWYDMYLMSRCTHNIIANSTFSWWGAMLNQNEEKIVIAPGKWVNGCEYLDIYPEEWITIKG